MPRSNQGRLAPGALSANHANESAEQAEPQQSASDMLAELSKKVEEGVIGVAELKKLHAKVTGKPARESKVKAEKAAATLEDVRLEFGRTISPWLIVHATAPAVKLFNAANGSLTMAEALSEVASIIAQFGLDALELRPEDAKDEPLTRSVGRLMETRFPERTAKLGQRFGQPAKPAPYTRASTEEIEDPDDERFDDEDDEEEDEEVGEAAESRS